MGKAEEIGAEKKLWESDEAWELRKAFMEAHYDDYSKIQLQCLSQLFINVTILGCEYSESLMEKIHEMGRGISAKMDRKKTAGGSYVKASTAKKRQAVKMDDIQEKDGSKKSKEEPLDNEAFNQRLLALKNALGLTPKHLSGEQMLKTAMTSCLLRWNVRKVNTRVEITIDRFLVLTHTFSQYCVDSEQLAVNSLIESLLSSTPRLNEAATEIEFDEKPASLAYAISMGRSLAKLKSSVTADRSVKGLTKALEAVNLSLIQNTRKLEGWSQQFDLVAGDILLATRQLGADQCAKPAMAKVAEEMAAEIALKIVHGKLLENSSENAHSSLRFSA